MKITLQNAIPLISDNRQGIGNTHSGASPLSLGEIVPVRVVGRSETSGYVLGLKDLSILADSDLPLLQGEKLMVKVEQLSPQIVLRILNHEGATAPMFREYALDYSGKPDALRDMIQMGQAILNDDSLLELLPAATKVRVRHILKLMDASVFSTKSLDNPLFLKDLVSNLGLMLERHLAGLAQEETGAQKPKPEEGLKGLLIALSEELRIQAMDGSDPGKEKAQKVAQLTRYVEAAVKTIENQQMINISPRGDGDHYILQIPFLGPDGIRTGELIIDTEQDSPADRTGKKYHVVMFLDMDALGDIMVDAALTGRKLTCLFRFTDGDAQQFFSPLLEELKKSIQKIGYECGMLQCVTVETIGEIKEEYHRALFHDRCEINVLA